MTEPSSTWLRVPPPDKMGRPGPLLLRFAAWLRASARQAARPIATDDAYLDWEASSAGTAWDYYQRFLPREGRLRILDVGAGPSGRTAHYARSRDALFMCLDLDHELQRVASRNLADELRDRVVPVVGEAGCLPFPAGSLDACLCENALEHFTASDQAIRDMARVLRPGGLLLALLPPWRGPFAGHLSRLTWLPWIHLLPPWVFLRLLCALQPGPEAVERARRAHVTATYLATHLNGWPLKRVLQAFEASRNLALVDAYVLGEGRVGRVLRFIPWLGEFFTGAIYLVFRRLEAERTMRLSFGRLLWTTLRGRSHRRLED
ncbi:MAG TPA: class I SAM-dependent methyltransferase [Vicinamibacteria bacterium]|nr:class I SAM-dependent methyltransferase [Vicinamibacteria bacterium]